jgi:hypothetical protein
MPRLSPAGWTILYVAVSLLVFVGFILAALATWKQSPHAMYCQVSCPFHVPPACSPLTKMHLPGPHRRSPFYREYNPVLYTSFFWRSVLT